MTNTNTTTTPKLNFGLGNAKLSKAIATFSLPAGHACPFAKECLSSSDRFTGKITDGKHCRFRCFAASGEARATSVRKARWHNFDMLKEADTVEKMARVIQKSLPEGLDKIRVHVSGDFFTEKYFLAWLNVALNNPLRLFYGYTKATPFLVKYKSHLPANFRFTASKGGTCDNLIGKHKLRSAEVVFSVEEAQARGLSIDHDDGLAMAADKSFALLLHGTQPAGTEANKAWLRLMAEGIGGYGTGLKFRKTPVDDGFNIYVTLKDGRIYLPTVAKHHNKRVLTQATSILG
jgi:hypothetical protein